MLQLTDAENAGRPGDDVPTRRSCSRRTPPGEDVPLEGEPLPEGTEGSTMRRLRRVKIVATLGPASNDEKTIEELARAGADVFRINMSHASHDLLKETVDTIRNVEKLLSHPLGILVDLQGPKLRVGTFEGGSVPARRRRDVHPRQLQRRRAPPSASTCPIPRSSSRCRSATGCCSTTASSQLKATRVGGGVIETEVIYGGKLSDKKGVSLPDTLLPVGALTEKDRADL